MLGLGIETAVHVIIENVYIIKRSESIFIEFECETVSKILTLM